jgi:uncharacterized membrane-anchored protein
MKKFTKITVLLPALFVIMTVYAFAAFVGYHINTMSAPLNLFITGVTMVVAGQFIKHHYRK